MNKVLITGVGGDIGQSIAKIIKRELTEYIIYGTDVHSRHAGKIITDKFFISPYATKENYISSLLSKIDKYEIKFLIPTNEFEIKKINESLFLFKKIFVLIPNKKTINIGLDKLKTAKFLSDINVNTPWTIDVKKNLPEKYPCIFKNRFSSGSRNIFLLSDQKEAKFFANKYPYSIFQEYLNDDSQEYTCTIFRSKSKKIKTIIFLRHLSGGMTSWAKEIDNKQINQLCIKIANKLNLVGSLNIQLRYHKKIPKIFEINPRFSSTVLMRNQLGFKDLIWFLFDAQKIKINLSRTPSLKEIVKVNDVSLLR